MDQAVAIVDVDLARVRDERLARLQAQMRARDLQVMLLANEPNVRYATGATAMPPYAMSTFVRCAVVPAEGTPILFEHGNSMHRSSEIAVDVRRMHAWEFFDDPAAEARTWVGEMLAAMDELGVGHGRIGLDRLGTPGLLALLEAGCGFVDSAPTTQGAREVKTPEEIRLFRANAPIVMDQLATVEASIEPGVQEREVFAAMARTGLERGVEYHATNTVCSGPNTNPWRAEATDRAIERGDLVYVDTDTVGVGGAFFCVSRTFACGSPSSAQRETYRAAYDWLEGMKLLVRPGITCGELAEIAPLPPERYLPQRYECMIHGVGLEEENPSVCFPADGQSNGDRVLEPGMLLVIELYCGEVGGDHGVKLGDEVLVTDSGIEVLAPYPFDEALST
jgi:Xaa-Pro aminopeptidase